MNVNIVQVVLSHSGWMLFMIPTTLGVKWVPVACPQHGHFYASLAWMLLCVIGAGCNCDFTWFDEFSQAPQFTKGSQSLVIASVIQRLCFTTLPHVFLGVPLSQCPSTVRDQHFSMHLSSSVCIIWPYHHSINRGSPNLSTSTPRVDGTILQVNKYTTTLLLLSSFIYFHVRP